MYRFYYFDAVRAEDHIYATTEGQGLVKHNNEGEVIQYTLNVYMEQIPVRYLLEID
jgi:hypothetical protein